ncbi:hypothetical protein G6F43_003729 [Rhizopus delemar]|nr:hypothetical protein G6F43_003729 [Rhizopus delemar]
MRSVLMVFGLLCAFMLVSSVPLDSASRLQRRRPSRNDALASGAIDRRFDPFSDTLEHSAHHVGELVEHATKE